jgi:high affinity Mn2+ porin
VHRRYLANGGLGFFIGDGNINYRPEKILEGYYNLGVTRSIWFSLDYQHITDPAYNADRGPVRIIGAWLHLEY